MSTLQFRIRASVILHVINNGGVVTLEQRLHEEAHGPNDADTYKDPQEKTVNHHCHIFPVFNDLQRENKILCVKKVRLSCHSICWFHSEIFRRY